MASHTREGKGYRLFKTTYRDRQGKTRQAAKWYVEFRDHLETVRRLPVFTSKAASDELGRNLVKLVAYHRASGGQMDPALTSWLGLLPALIKTKLAEIGLVDPRHIMTSKSLEDHLDDFKAKMIADDCGSEHVHDTIRLIKLVLDACGFRFPNEIEADAVNRFVVGLRKQGKSTRRINAYLTAVKGFTRWLATQGKIPSDPLTTIKKGNVTSDRRYERRPFTVDEFRWLTATSYDAMTRYGMTGPERALLYSVAVQTGLRSNELRSLTAGQCNLHRDQPTVTCKAKASKNSKDAHQHVRPETAEELRDLVVTKAPTAPVFKMPHESKVAEMLRADLREARDAWIAETAHDPQEQARRRESDFLSSRDAEDRRLDFHALRYTTGAWLAMAGVHPRKIQRVMRHSTITLTMDTYGHLFPGEEAETVAFFPNMTTKPSEPAKATGTLGPCEGEDVLALRLAPMKRSEQPERGAGGRSSNNEGRSRNLRKTLRTAAFDGVTRGSNNKDSRSAACPSGPRERIANPLA